MKGIKKSDLESKGYKEKGKIDLVNNKKEAILVNVWGIAIIVVMLLIIPLLYKANIVISPGEKYFISMIAFIVLMLLYIPLHEIVHGITLKCFSDEKLSFGWKLVYAYCGSKEAAMRPNEYFIVALAPLVVFSLVFIPLMFINKELSLVWYALEAMNVSGSIGDIYVTVKLWKERNNDTLITDSGTDMTFWSK